MLMGVNDASQLPFLENLPDKIKRRLIKPEKNKDIGYNIDKQADEIIRNSDIICIYGMSIGATDTVWWKKMGSWLLSSNAKAIIYFVHDGNVDTNSVFGIDHIRDAEEDYRNKLFDAMDIPTNKLTEVRKKIFVIINSEFMQVRLVTDDTVNNPISNSTQPQMNL